MRPRGGHGHQEQFWIVICPELRVQGGVWRKWFREGYVAIGWPPPGHGEKDEFEFSFGGRSTDPTWSARRNCLREMRVGDKIIPFLMDWRIGPVGTIRALPADDSGWHPTVRPDVYTVGPEDDNHISKVPELGRRIGVVWQSQGMPPDGKVARVPRPASGARVSRAAIRRLLGLEFTKFISILGNPDRWEPLDGHRGVKSI